MNQGTDPTARSDLNSINADAPAANQGVRQDKESCCYRHSTPPPARVNRHPGGHATAVTVPPPVAVVSDSLTRDGAAGRCRAPWRGLARLRQTLRHFNADPAMMDRAAAELGRRVGIPVEGQPC
jgi:hypothetical protein